MIANITSVRFGTPSSWKQDLETAKVQRFQKMTKGENGSKRSPPRRRTRVTLPIVRPSHCAAGKNVLCLSDEEPAFDKNAHTANKLQSIVDVLSAAFLIIY